MSKGPEGCWASGGSMFGLGQPWVRLWPSWHTLNPPFALELLRRRTQKTHPVSSKRGISFFTRSIHYHPNWNRIFKRVFKSVTWCYSHFRFKMSEHLCGIQAKGVARVISGLWLKYHRPIFNDFKKKRGGKKSHRDAGFDRKWCFCWCFPGMKLALCGCRLESRLVNSPVLLSGEGGLHA